MKQWKVVVVAFLTAATFWFFNSLNKNYTTSLNYPVEFNFDRDSLVTIKRLPASIELDVTGGGWSLLRKTALFSPEPLNVKLENPVGLATLNWIEMLPIIREQITDLNVNQILEDTLSLRIEPRLKKWVTPALDSSKISLENGYRITSGINLSEDSILVEGPKSFVDTLGTTFTFPITDENIDDDFSEVVEILTPDVHLITSLPNSIEVNFTVEEFLNRQLTVRIDPVNFPGDSTWIMNGSTVQIDYIVQESIDSRFDENDFIVIADFEMMRSSDSTVLPMLTGFPEEAMEISIQPEVIKVIPRER